MSHKALYCNLHCSSLQVKLSTDVGMDYSSKHSVAPAMTFLLTVKARKESWLGLLAVDQSVYYLRNKSRVTHKKVSSVYRSIEHCRHLYFEQNADLILLLYFYQKLLPQQQA